MNCRPKRRRFISSTSRRRRPSRSATSCARKRPGAKIEDVPMLRGRIISANGIKAEDLKPKEEAAWVLRSDRGITYSGTVPEGSRVVEGKWWGPDYKGPPLVSFEKKIADGLGLKLGDPVTVNVLGRNITVKIANMRIGRLAESGDQFRHGVFAARLRRRAAHPYRHADLSRRRHDSGRDRSHPRGRRRTTRWSPPSGSKTRSTPSVRLSPIWWWRSAALRR